MKNEETGKFEEIVKLKEEINKLKEETKYEEGRERMTKSETCKFFNDGNVMM